MSKKNVQWKRKRKGRMKNGKRHQREERKKILIKRTDRNYTKYN